MRQASVYAHPIQLFPHSDGEVLGREEVGVEEHPGKSGSLPFQPRVQTLQFPSDLLRVISLGVLAFPPCARCLSPSQEPSFVTFICAFHILNYHAYHVSEKCFLTLRIRFTADILTALYVGIVMKTDDTSLL